MEQTHTIPLQQAKGLHARVTAYNASLHEVMSYFAPIIDGLGLPAETTFVSIDPESGEMKINAPESA